MNARNDFFTLRRFALAAAASSLVACGGAVQPGSDQNTGSTTSGSGGTSGSSIGGASTTTAGVGGLGGSPPGCGGTNQGTGGFSDAGTQFPAVYPPAACAIPEQNPSTPQTVEEYQQQLIGRWLTCMGSIFGTMSEIGLEFAADGNWYKLYPGLPCNVQRGQGFDQQGIWDVSAGGPQLNIRIVGGGGIPVHAAFTSLPRKMRLTTDSINQGTYAIDQ